MCKKWAGVYVAVGWAWVLRRNRVYWFQKKGRGRIARFQGRVPPHHAPLSLWTFNPMIQVKVMCESLRVKPYIFVSPSLTSYSFWHQPKGRCSRRHVLTSATTLSGASLRSETADSSIKVTPCERRDAKGSGTDRGSSRLLSCHLPVCGLIAIIELRDADHKARSNNTDNPISAGADATCSRPLGTGVSRGIRYVCWRSVAGVANPLSKHDIF